MKATQYVVVNSITGLLLKRYSEILKTTNIHIYHGKCTLSDIKLTDTLNKNEL